MLSDGCIFGNHRRHGQPYWQEGSFSSRWSVGIAVQAKVCTSRPLSNFVHVRGKLSLFNQTVRGSGSANLSVQDSQRYRLLEMNWGFEPAVHPEQRRDLWTGNEEWLGNVVIPAPKLGSILTLILDEAMPHTQPAFHYGPKLTLPQPKFFPFVEISAGFGW